MSEQEKPLCVSCGKTTDWLCADCRIDKKLKVYVCESPECRDKHEASGCSRIPIPAEPPAAPREWAWGGNLPSPGAAPDSPPAFHDQFENMGWPGTVKARCQSRQPHWEGVQCELSEGHGHIHLAGEYCWPIQPPAQPMSAREHINLAALAEHLSKQVFEMAKMNGASATAVQCAIESALVRAELQGRDLAAHRTAALEQFKEVK